MSAAIPVEAHDSSTSMDNDSKVRLGMLFYVLTDVTFVIFLLVGYVWLRAYNVNGDWYPFKSFSVPDEGTSFVLLLLMVASGVCFFIGYRAILAGNKALLSVFATLALILTVVTLVGQIRFMGSQPFAAQDGSFASEWLLLSGYHIYPPPHRHIPWPGAGESRLARTLFERAAPWRDHHRLLLVLDGVDAGDCVAVDDPAAAQDLSPFARETETEVHMVALLTDLPRTLVELALVAVLAAIYWRGTANARRAGLENSLGRLRIAAFAAGLLVLFVALSGPVEAAGGSWLIAVVGQQQAIVLLAAPLLLLGAPRWAFSLALPASLRRRVLNGGGSGASGRIVRALFRPIPTLVVYVAATTIWYAPTLFDAVLRSSALRALMQVVLLAASLLFWAQVIPSRPAWPRLNDVARALYLGVAGMWSSMIGAFYMFSVAPYYERYIVLDRPVGAASALVDQHLAGAVLDVPGVTVFFWGWRR